VAEIDVDAFRHNLRTIQDCLQPDCEIMAVVKADAYGHGAVALAEAALAGGATWLGVGRCLEGAALRQQGIRASTLVLGPAWSDETDALIHHRLTPTIGRCEDADQLNREAARRRLTYPMHLKVDTGMSRYGLLPKDCAAFFDKLAGWPHLRLQGVMTHLASADVPDDGSKVRRQLDDFRGVLQAAAARGVKPQYVHAAGSAGIFRYPESHWNLVRPGISLYGSHPFPSRRAGELRPVMRWTTRLFRIQAVPAGTGVSYGHTFVTRRPSRLGTLPVGYADGLDRGLSDVGEVLIRGRRAPMVGRVCMGLCVIDLTDVPQAQAGDEVVLIGAQGQDHLTVDDMAQRCGRIPYEVLCAVGQQVPRRYVGSGA
jgi:alanine racemase